MMEVLGEQKCDSDCGIVNEMVRGSCGLIIQVYSISTISSAKAQSFSNVTHRLI